MRAKVASRYVQYIWQKNARLKCPKKKERELRDDRHSNEYWLCNNNGDYSIGRNCCPKQHIRREKMEKVIKITELKKREKEG